VTAVRDRVSSKQTMVVNDRFEGWETQIEWAQIDERRMPVSIRSVNSMGYYTILYQLPRQKQAESPGDLLLRALAVSPIRWGIRFEERQEGLGSGGRRNGNRFRCIALGAFRGEVCGEGSNGELFYGTGVIFGSLSRGTSVVEEVETWGVVPSALACSS
jgi:hypothetical protein